MARSYTEGLQRRPLDSVPGTTTGGGGGPPTGPAGGDLTGSYPNPTIGPGAVGDAEIVSVAYAKVTGAPTALPPSGAAGGDLTGTYPAPTIGALKVTDAKITDVAWGKITGAPSAFPPSGTASGDLTGTYPGPTIAAAKVTGPKLSPAPVAGDVGKMVTIAAGPALAYTAVPTSLPPSGAASGDLTGSYPGPTIAANAVGDAEISDVAATKLTGTIAQARLPTAPSGLLTANINDAQITDAKISDVAYAKVTGAPTALPPSGTAGGDLAGTYPNPTVDGLNGAAVGTTTPLARGDLLVANATPAFTRLAKGSTGQVLAATATDAVWQALAQSQLPTAPSGLLTANINDAQVTNVKIADVAWSKVTGAPASFPPSGTASGDLSGSYPGPTIAAGAVTTTKLGDAPNGITTAKLNDGAVTNAKIADVAWTKVTGAPSSFPPSGAASGDLGGTYPGPTVAKVNGAPLGTTTPLARGDLLVANATPALMRLARGAVNEVLQSNGTDVVWGPAPATGGPPTGAAGGSLAGSYPNPTLAASGVTAGTYGDQYNVAKVTVTAEGRVTAVVPVLIRARWG